MANSEKLSKNCHLNPTLSAVTVSVVPIILIMPELQIRGGILRISSYLSMKTCCDPSLELPQQDGSNDMSQYNVFREKCG